MTGSKVSFAGSSLSYWQDFNKQMIPTGGLLRFETGFKVDDWSLQAAPALGFDNEGNKTPQLRFRAKTPTVPLGKANNVSFSANGEYRATLKFDEEFKKTDFVQEGQCNISAKSDDYKVKITPKTVYSEKNPTFKFNGVKLTLQKTIGDWDLFFDTKFKPEAFKKGDFSETSYCLGVGYSF